MSGGSAVEQIIVVPEAMVFPAFLMDLFSAIVQLLQLERLGYQACNSRLWLHSCAGDTLTSIYLFIYPREIQIILIKR